MSAAKGSTAGLALGNVVKSRRAELKRQVAAGRVDVADLLDGDPDLEDHEEVALGMTIAALLGAVDGVGPGAMLRLARTAGLTGLSLRLGDLTVPRRRALAAAVRADR